MKSILTYRFGFILILITALTSALTTACSKEDFLPDANLMDISAQIVPIQNSRVQMSQGGTGKFSDADRITMFISTDGSSSSAYELTYTNAGWTPQLSWDAIQADRASFVAVYPVVKDMTSYITVHSVANDQRSTDAFLSSDLLTAKTTAQRGEQIKLDFYHKMHRVVVHLGSKNEAFTEQELASATLTMKAYRQIAFNPRTTDLGEVTGTQETITFQQVSGTTFQAIVCPQTIFPAWRNEGWIEIKIGKQKLVYKAPETLNGGITFEQLESGKQVTFNITLDKSSTEGGGDEVDWRNKTCWVYGVKNIPPINQWGYYLWPQKDENGKPKNEVFALEWKREYGWYDCNKKDPVASTYNDSQLCWAATCSNMIYWWLEHNAANLKRFGYQGPITYNNDLDCEVFQYFKDHFTDNGLHIDIGLDWFFCGISIPSGNNAQPTRPHDGFFKDVLKAPLTEKTSIGGYNLSKTLKKAFLEKKAVGMSVILNSYTAAHAITIWGAGFDENGEVNVLYVVENNDKDSNTNTWPMRPGIMCNAGIFTKRVQIDPNNGKALIEGGAPGICSIEIDYLILMGLHTAEWEAYFNRPENAGK